MESSAITIGLLQIGRSPILSTSVTCIVVSGAISATIFSKSKMITSSFPHWAIPVATLSAPFAMVLSGFCISFHEILLIPSMLSTLKATVILLKFVTINKSLGPFSRSFPVRYFARLITVISSSLGLKMPSTAGFACGIGFTFSLMMISWTFATLMP